MEDGRIVEIGNHNTLLEKQGKYYDIYRTQFKDFLSLGDEEVS
jgi:ATP-binding cassette subfamily B protein